MPTPVTNLALGPDSRLQTSQSSAHLLGSTNSKSSDASSKASEFEAILLGQWLQGSESAFGSVPGGEDDADAGADQMKSFAFQHLASGLAEKGGIGIAKMVKEAIASEVKASSSAGSLQASATAQQATSSPVILQPGIGDRKSVHSEEGQ